MSRLPEDAFVRKLVESGKTGNGVEQAWQPTMREHGIKAARVEVYMTWFFGPKNPTPVRAVYYSSYDLHDQISDPTILARIRASGVEDKLKAEAVREAPKGHWVDLPHSVLRPFRAATGVTIWDDPWLPNLPQSFTTFGLGRPPLVAAIGFGDLADVDRLLTSGKLDRAAINEALGYACGDQETSVLTRLLKAGADVNRIQSDGEFGSCLMMAIWSTAPDAVKLLVTSGAKVNGSQGKSGETPLILAASLPGDATDMLKVLVSAGAEVNASSHHGITALMAATHRQPATALTFLIQHGANVNMQSKQGRSALWFASERGNIDALKVLLAAHADTTLRDDQGRTALDVAANEHIAEILRTSAKE